MAAPPLTYCLLVVITLSGCQQKAPGGEPPVYATTQFHQYWHSGKAEISSYQLSQSRYGEKRPGRAVLIFVTEDLSKRDHVKLDDPSAGNKVNVLKLNVSKKFITGIYPYSMMLSVFTPVNRAENPATIKASMSSQEWCGHVYTQLNLRGNRYAIKSHSYFEQEGDESFSVRNTLLEDEIWSRIRLDHHSLPTGDVDVVPSLFHARLNHTGIGIQQAVGERTETDTAYWYTLVYPAADRTLSIAFSKKFPFHILGWREKWMEDGTNMETSALLYDTLYTDYWTKNSNVFLHLRDSLNLPNAY